MLIRVIITTEKRRSGSLEGIIYTVLIKHHHTMVAGTMGRKRELQYHGRPVPDEDAFYIIPFSGFRP